MFLRRSKRLAYEALPVGLRAVDLFAGCGGLTLGLSEAARRLGASVEVPLAVEFDHRPARVFEVNFPAARVVTDPVEELFDGELSARPTSRERVIRRQVGHIDWLQGGPPCQGYSDLNNHTRRDDPRNSLYVRMARAAEVLTPRVVVIENVPAVLSDRSGAVPATIDYLRRLGYQVSSEVARLDAIGVPQLRKRHIVLATRLPGVEHHTIWRSIESGQRRHLRWAIGDLEDADASPLDAPTSPTPDNTRRIEWLFEHLDEPDLPNELRPACHQGDHKYKSMYGRLDWELPAQTVTSGFGSMGQGRYVHPSRRRTLTPHEAARIQFFPDWFDLTADGDVMHRMAWANMIGNAVPPKLTMELGRLLLPHLRS